MYVCMYVPNGLVHLSIYLVDPIDNKVVANTNELQLGITESGQTWFVQLPNGDWNLWNSAGSHQLRREAFLFMVTMMLDLDSPIRLGSLIVPDLR